MNGKAVTQYEITEMGIQQFEEYVDFLESVIKGRIYNIRSMRVCLYLN